MVKPILEILGLIWLFVWSILWNGFWLILFLGGVVFGSYYIWLCYKAITVTIGARIEEYYKKKYQ